MIRHDEIESKALFRLIRSGDVSVGGNARLKIFGALSCKSGKRMLRKNRVFFENEADAIQQGYRPCGHCMQAAYLAWKANQG